MGIVTVLGVLYLVAQHVIAAVGDFTGGSWVAFGTEVAYCVSAIGFMFHLHYKFNLFGFSVDSTVQPK